MNEISWGKIALLALTLAITFYFTEQAGKHAAWPGEVKVMISSQNLDGQPVLKMDSNMLKTLESRMVKLARVEIEKSFAADGLPSSANEEIDITSEASYIGSGLTKLAVIRLKTSVRSSRSSQMFSVTVMGITENELKTVYCYGDFAVNRPISISDGVCGNKIKEVFDVRAVK